MSLNSELLAIIVVCATVQIVLGHGSVHDPVCRQTRWRYDRTAVPDYSDTQVFCGGFKVQFEKNGGHCGVCGDDYAAATPREHELGGKYGQGVIVKSYPAGGQLPVSVQITANHKGHFEFQMCSLDGNGGKENEQCFARNPLKLSNGQDKYVVPTDQPGKFDVVLQLPANLRCKHCVLRWTYVAGNNWGSCGNGKSGLGCGDQEHFRSCSDIEVK